MVPDYRKRQSGIPESRNPRNPWKSLFRAFPVFPMFEDKSDRNPFTSSFFFSPR